MIAVNLVWTGPSHPPTRTRENQNQNQYTAETSKSKSAERATSWPPDEPHRTAPCRTSLNLKLRSKPNSQPNSTHSALPTQPPNKKLPLWSSYMRDRHETW
ncbi:uncharacterized protein YALI1_F16177g [Yarrowia lipolytica]|uniref:Uncharacterized protein n=1 Tax=Yarrowia lipolytica TaxID=4952 RepID=A0A1D8NN25_YARLL|nr:hypothetical protein YALI1_F16177g [Yarrowia lipolytica]